MQATTPTTIFGLDKVNYPKYRDKLIELYTLSFTEGRYAQFISAESIEVSLDNIMRIGFGFMTLYKDNIIGAAICVALKNDPDFPIDRHSELNLERTLYITDLMVDQNYRGRGVAQELLEYVIEMIQQKPYDQIIIRVWDKNIPAVSLYQKLGFEEVDAIYQTKLDKENKQPFEMRKLYMKKEL